MKKLLVIFSVLAVLSACGGNSTKTAATNDSVAVDTTLVDSISADSVVVDTVSVD